MTSHPPAGEAGSLQLDMFEELLNNKDSWLNGSGPSADIIFSSRIRLARNFNLRPFPSQANHTQKEDVFNKIKDIFPRIKRLKKAAFISLQELNELDKQFLVERHLISQEHTVNTKSKGLLLSLDEKIAIMINEEDHLRMQVMTSGFDLKFCWQVIDEIDNELSKYVEFAFSMPFGYLTACPTNVGTALRASCMLHLPALVLTKRIGKVLELLAKILFTTRGLFGEGTQALGDFFQVSNQASLGLCETELIDNLSGVVKQVKEQEVDARNLLFKKHKFNLEDNIWRSFGILKNCRLISSKEALSHLSMLCLGSDLGIINNIKRELINSLFISIQPAHLQKIEAKELREEERDYTRAQILRDKLSQKTEDR